MPLKPGDCTAVRNLRVGGVATLSNNRAITGESTRNTTLTMHIPYKRFCTAIFILLVRGPTEAPVVRFPRSVYYVTNERDITSKRKGYASHTIQLSNNERGKAMNKAQEAGLLFAAALTDKNIAGDARKQAKVSRTAAYANDEGMVALWAIITAGGTNPRKALVTAGIPKAVAAVIAPARPEFKLFATWVTTVTHESGQPAVGVATQLVYNFGQGGLITTARKMVDNGDDPTEYMKATAKETVEAFEVWAMRNAGPSGRIAEVKKELEGLRGYSLSAESRTELLGILRAEVSHLTPKKAPQD